MKSAKITSWGNYFPERVLTNDDLEKMVDTSDEWITTRTGIKERRLAADNEYTSDMAAKAAQAAIRRADIKPDEIDAIIVATITPDMSFPSTSCFVQKKIKAFNAACMDIAAACSGYIYALSIADSYIKTGMYSKILIIGAEKLSAITDWSDRNTCVLFGDGAGACIVEPAQDKNEGLLSFYLGADGRHSELLYLPASGTRNPASHETVDNHLHYIRMKGSELFKIATKKMADSATEALKRAGLDCSDVSLVVPHQANIRIINAVLKKLQLDENKVFLNIHRYGNMSAASTATALNEAIDSGRVKKGDVIVLTAFGGGLTWGAGVIRW